MLGRISGEGADREDVHGSQKDYCQVGGGGEQDDTKYREGIYVGYRYFDTVNQTPLFPFGYGLGYTRSNSGIGWEPRCQLTYYEVSLLKIKAACSKEYRFGILSVGKAAPIGCGFSSSKSIIYSLLKADFKTMSYLMVNIFL